MAAVLTDFASNPEDVPITDPIGNTALIEAQEALLEITPGDAAATLALGDLRGRDQGVSYYGDFKVNERLDANWGTVDQLREPYYDHEAATKAYADAIAAAAISADSIVLSSAAAAAAAADSIVLSSAATAAAAADVVVLASANAYTDSSIGSNNHTFVIENTSTAGVPSVRSNPGSTVCTHTGADGYVQIPDSASPGRYNITNHTDQVVNLVGDTNVTIYDGTGAIKTSVIINTSSTFEIVPEAETAPGSGIFTAARSVYLISAGLTNFVA